MNKPPRQTSTSRGGGSSGDKKQAEGDRNLVKHIGGGGAATAVGAAAAPTPAPAPAAGGRAGGGGGGGGTKGGKRGGEAGAPASFLNKLWNILNEPHLSKHITWNQDGDGIVVNHPAQFAKAVLPKYYKHNNYQSFVRQLNIYGFHKTRHDDDGDEESCEFQHQNFRKGQRHLLGLIRRKAHSTSVAAQETKGSVDRIAVELRAMCNRVTHLEAEMGMIKHRHNHLRVESRALLRLLLSEGGRRLEEKALAVLGQLPHTSGEAELSGLPSVVLHPEDHEQEQHHHQHDQHPQHDQHYQYTDERGPIPMPEEPPAHFRGSDLGGERFGAGGAAEVGDPTARGGGVGAARYSRSGAALASVVAAALASNASEEDGEADGRSTGASSGALHDPPRPRLGGPGRETAWGGMAPNVDLSSPSRGLATATFSGPAAAGSGTGAAEFGGSGNASFNGSEEGAARLSSDAAAASKGSRAPPVDDRGRSTTAVARAAEPAAAAAAAGGGSLPQGSSPRCSYLYAVRGGREQVEAGRGGVRAGKRSIRGSGEGGTPGERGGGGGQNGADHSGTVARGKRRAV
ncbi:Heat Shock transcription factor [Ectocarpus siliculosus]|uniref:Heat Shock transcription factor n=1 Tax=Ectocarpus siliculosus TaxID=2880 RepID=D7FT89_ECTSI|nr:Heat Shock transcription factor [Ectocarpus siliculosus]|eukprot:CBJ31355.1 Heat Shock transcription factor [Ectocarpus siliculosus]